MSRGSHRSTPVLGGPVRASRWVGVPWLAVAAGLFGCEPPPEVVAAEGEPSVEILHPPRDVGEVSLVASNGSCFLDLLVVADVRNFIYVSPDENKEDVDGEGHFHFNVNGVYKDAPSARSFEWRSAPNEFQTGNRVQISVTLASNTHRDLDTLAGWIDVIEFNVVSDEPACGGAGSGGDTDDADDTGDTDDSLLPLSALDGGSGW